MSVKVRVFVYGTLKSGDRANHMLGPGANLLGTTKIPGVLISLGSYPGLVHDDVCEAKGEVWEINAETLARLDMYEGVSRGFYERKEIPGPWGTMFYYELVTDKSPTDLGRLVAKEGLWRPLDQWKTLSPLRSYREERAFWNNVKGEDAPKAGILHDAETGETRPAPIDAPNGATEGGKLKAALERIYGPDLEADKKLLPYLTDNAEPSGAQCPIPEPASTPLVVPKLG